MSSTVPPISSMPLGMDFLKQFWSQNSNFPQSAPSASSAQSPSAHTVSPAFAQAMGQYFMPTFDLEELDRRIGDLRTVLQFMEMNTQMLRQSLNALEVQRNTVAALQSMQQSNAAPSAPGGQPVKSDQDTVQPWLAGWQQMMQTASSLSQSMTANVEPKPATPVKKSGTTKTVRPNTSKTPPSKPVPASKTRK